MGILRAVWVPSKLISTIKVNTKSLKVAIKTQNLKQQ